MKINETTLQTTLSMLKGFDPEKAWLGENLKSYDKTFSGALSALVDRVVHFVCYGRNLFSSENRIDSVNDAYSKQNSLPVDKDAGGTNARDVIASLRNIYSTKGSPSDYRVNTAWEDAYPTPPLTPKKLSLSSPNTEVCQRPSSPKRAGLSTNALRLSDPEALAALPSIAQVDRKLPSNLMKLSDPEALAALPSLDWD